MGFCLEVATGLSLCFSRPETPTKYRYLFVSALLTDRLSVKRSDTQSHLMALPVWSWDTVPHHEAHYEP